MTTLAPWLLTYLVHSTALLGAAALACLALGPRRLVLQEALLRAALVGGFVTASVPLALGVRPIGGVWHVALPAPGAGFSAVSGADTALAADVILPRVPRPLALGSGDEVEAAGTAPLERRSSVWTTALSSWTILLAAVWAMLALLALARLGVAAARLRRLLRTRQPIESAGLRRRAAAVATDLGLRRSVRLSRARDLPVPLATGVVRPEVCLPERTLTDLEDDEQVALCAHELAHVARRDPAWILLARLIEAAAPLQPLNLWARRRLHHVAECLSDDLAVAASGRPLGLARSLVDVASWTVPEAVSLSAVAAGALGTRSRLRYRVERLMDPLHQPERPRRLALPVAAAAVLTTALVTPAVFGGGARASSPPATPPRTDEAAKTATAVEAAPASSHAKAEAGAEAEGPAKAEGASTSPEAARREAVARTERALEELTAHIEARSREHSRQIEALQAEIAAEVGKSLPPREELARYEAEVASAAQAMAEAERDRGRGAGDATSRAEADKARERLDEARRRLQEAGAAARAPSAELRRLTEQIRAIAAASAPTPEEREELRRLGEELARQSADTGALAGEMRDLGGELGRDLGRDLRRQMSAQVTQEALRQTMSELRETLQETSRALQEALRSSRFETDEAMQGAAREAMRSAQKAMRGARDEARRALRESGAAMEEAAPEPPAPPDVPDAPEPPEPPGLSEAPRAPAPPTAAPVAPAPPKATATPAPPPAPAAAEAPPAPEAPPPPEAPPEPHRR